MTRKSASLFSASPVIWIVIELGATSTTVARKGWIIAKISARLATGADTLVQDLEVITEDVPMLIEVDISRKEHVLPMVPAGKSNHEMLGVKFHA